MVQSLGPLTDMCMRGLGDQQPHVRWAACQALGQMCSDLGPDIQDTQHARILPGLMALMDDFNHPRVQVSGWRLAVGSWRLTVGFLRLQWPRRVVRVPRCPRSSTRTYHTVDEINSHLSVLHPAPCTLHAHAVRRCGELTLCTFVCPAPLPRAFVGGYVV